jgi:hypothetical protein
VISPAQELIFCLVKADEPALVWPKVLRGPQQPKGPPPKALVARPTDAPPRTSSTTFPAVPAMHITPGQSSSSGSGKAAGKGMPPWYNPPKAGAQNRGWGPGDWANWGTRPAAPAAPVTPCKQGTMPAAPLQNISPVTPEGAFNFRPWRPAWVVPAVGAFITPKALGAPVGAPAQDAASSAALAVASDAAISASAAASCAALAIASDADASDAAIAASTPLGAPAALLLAPEDWAAEFGSEVGTPEPEFATPLGAPVGAPEFAVILQRNPPEFTALFEQLQVEAAYICLCCL